MGDTMNDETKAAVETKPVSLQQLHDCGLNPFAVQLLYESWKNHKTSPRQTVSFPFADCVVSIQDLEAYRAEHLVDDDELITVGWCAAQGKHDRLDFRYEKEYQFDSVVTVKFFACAGPKCWDAKLIVGPVYEDRSKVIANPTRGQLRSLLKAIGVK